MKKIEISVLLRHPFYYIECLMGPQLFYLGLGPPPDPWRQFDPSGALSKGEKCGAVFSPLTTYIQMNGNLGFMGARF